MLKIKCHICGRDAKLIGSGIECNDQNQSSYMVLAPSNPG